MSTLTLRRKIKTEGGLVGTLEVDEQLLAYTLELPYKGNQRNVSCIPAGGYTWSLGQSSRLYQSHVIMLDEVKGRDGILIHPGNYISETKGCILVGTGSSITGWYTPSLLSSRSAMYRILKALDGAEDGFMFILECF